MTKRDERAEDVKAAGAGEGRARRPPTRVISEAVVAAIPETLRREPPVVSEAEEEATPAEGRADDGAGA